MTSYDYMFLFGVIRGYNIAEIAAITGKSDAYVRRRLRKMGVLDGK